MKTSKRFTYARICESYIFHQMPVEEIARITKVSTMTVSRTIDRILTFRKITDRGTKLIKGEFKLEEV